MAKHFKKVRKRNDSLLRVEGLESIRASIRGGNCLRSLLQRETFWIYKLNAVIYPGLNEEIDYTPIL